MNSSRSRFMEILFAAFALAATTSFSEEGQIRSSGDALTLNGAIQAALAENPEIAAARKKWEAARARIAQAATPDKPRLDFERMYAPRDTNPISGAEERNVAVSQEIPFPTSLYYRGRAAKKAAGMAEASFKAKEREVISRVKSAYAMLYLSHHSIHIFEANTDLMRQFAKVAESKYAVGKASQNDVLKAQVELSRMLNRLVTLEQERETNRAMLNTLLNRNPEDFLGLPEEPAPLARKMDLDQLTARALSERPELREATLGVERGNAMVSAARSEYLPDIMLLYRQRDMMNEADSHDAMVGLSLPLWFWKQGAMVREAKAEREMAEAEAKVMTNMTRFDVKNLLVKVQTEARLIDLYRNSVLPQSEQALKVAETAYQADKTGFLDMLDAARSFLDFRLEHYEHVAEYQVLLADLERTVGHDLKEDQ